MILQFFFFRFGTVGVAVLMGLLIFIRFKEIDGKLMEQTRDPGLLETYDPATTPPQFKQLINLNRIAGLTGVISSIFLSLLATFPRGDQPIFTVYLIFIVGFLLTIETYMVFMLALFNKLGTNLPMRSLTFKNFKFTYNMYWIRALLVVLSLLTTIAFVIGYIVKHEVVSIVFQYILNFLILAFFATYHFDIKAFIILVNDNHHHQHSSVINLQTL